MTFPTSLLSSLRFSHAPLPYLFRCPLPPPLSSLFLPPLASSTYPTSFNYPLPLFPLFYVLLPSPSLVSPLSSLLSSPFSHFLPLSLTSLSISHQLFLLRPLHSSPFSPASFSLLFPLFIPFLSLLYSLFLSLFPSRFLFLFPSFFIYFFLLYFSFSLHFSFYFFSLFLLFPPSSFSLFPLFLLFFLSLP